MLLARYCSVSFVLTLWNRLGFTLLMPSSNIRQIVNRTFHSLTKPGTFLESSAISRTNRALISANVSGQISNRLVRVYCVSATVANGRNLAPAYKASDYAKSLAELNNLCSKLGYGKSAKDVLGVPSLASSFADFPYSSLEQRSFSSAGDFT